MSMVAFLAQMISSINGALLDSWTLTKPANFKADLAGRSAFVSSWVPRKCQAHKILRWVPPWRPKVPLSALPLPPINAVH